MQIHRPLSPALSPTHACSIWCLFELWQAVGFGGGSEKLHMMTDDAGLLHMRAAYAAVCSRKADARCQQDRLNFLDLIA